MPLAGSASPSPGKNLAACCHSQNLLAWTEAFWFSPRMCFIKIKVLISNLHRKMWQLPPGFFPPLQHQKAWRNLFKTEENAAFKSPKRALTRSCNHFRCTELSGGENSSHLESRPNLRQKGRGLVCRRAKHSDFSLKSKKLQLLRAIENHAQNL